MAAPAPEELEAGGARVRARELREHDLDAADCAAAPAAAPGAWFVVGQYFDMAPLRRLRCHRCPRCGLLLRPRRLEARTLLPRRRRRQQCRRPRRSYWPRT